MRPAWIYPAVAGALLGAVLTGCDKTAGPGAAPGDANAVATDGPNQVVMSVPGMT
jgi:hypothetical protein